MKQLNEKELSVFAGFAVLGAPDPISGETSVTQEERIALYRALRIDHFEVSKDEFAEIEALYDQGEVTIEAAGEKLRAKKPLIQQKIYKAVYNSVKALAGGSEEKLNRGDRRSALEELKAKLDLPDAPAGGGSSSEAPKKKSKALLYVFIILLLAAAGAAFFMMKK